MFIIGLFVGAMEINFLGRVNTKASKSNPRIIFGVDGSETGVYFLYFMILTLLVTCRFVKDCVLAIACL